ncbi:hypothetical protein [Flavobacterium magnum]|nr:hypothetical protein [Flavobacterium magnum]
MMTRFRKIIKTLVVFFICHSAFSFVRPSHCLALFDIHRGYNAFKNIAVYSVGYRPDLASAAIIYERFPEGNESMKAASQFLMDYAVRSNHPEKDIILATESDANGHFLSYLSLAEAVAESGKDWQYNSKLKETPSYNSLYHQTIIWEYAFQWDSRKPGDAFTNPGYDFITSYDALLAAGKQLTESESLLYQLFKLQIRLNADKDVTAFLSQLETLIAKHQKHFSISNYKKFLAKYYPDYKPATPFRNTSNDNFDTDEENANPIFAGVNKSADTLDEAIVLLKRNPFRTDLFGYSQVERMMKNETFEHIMKCLSELETMEASYPKVCSVSANSFDLIRNVIDSESIKFNEKQSLTLKSRLLKKWADFHIACHITLFFYIDEIIVSYWNELPATEQATLNAYFEKEFDRTDSHNYLLQLQKALKLK